VCDSEYEYWTVGVGSTGQASPLAHVTHRKPRPLGLLAATQRSNEMAKKKRSKVAGKAAAKAKADKRQSKKAKGRKG